MNNELSPHLSQKEKLATIIFRIFSLLLFLLSIFMLFQKSYRLFLLSLGCGFIFLSLAAIPKILFITPADSKKSNHSPKSNLLLIIGLVLIAISILSHFIFNW